MSQHQFSVGKYWHEHGKSKIVVSICQDVTFMIKMSSELLEEVSSFNYCRMKFVRTKQN